MPRKKLPHHQVLRVEEARKGERSVVLLPIPLDQLRSVEAPEGTWTNNLDTLILPKRKRGVKFRVIYTQVFKKEI